MSDTTVQDVIEAIVNVIFDRVATERAVAEKWQRIAENVLARAAKESDGLSKVLDLPFGADAGDVARVVKERDDWKEKANVLCESALKAERERDSLSLALSAIMEMLGVESNASLLPCALHNERAASQERWERAERERDELIGQAADFAQERDELRAVVADAAQALFVEHAPLTIASAARDALDTIDSMRRESHEWKARAEAAEAGLAGGEVAP